MFLKASVVVPCCTPPFHCQTPFSENGVWQWKGGVQQGTTTDSFRDLMPLPATDLGINTNLEQNPGY